MKTTSVMPRASVGETGFELDYELFIHDEVLDKSFKLFRKHGHCVDIVCAGGRSADWTLITFDFLTRRLHGGIGIDIVQEIWR
jgi:hypothetical protein